MSRRSHLFERHILLWRSRRVAMIIAGGDGWPLQNLVWPHVSDMSARSSSWTQRCAIHSTCNQDWRGGSPTRLGVLRGGLNPNQPVFQYPTRKSAKAHLRCVPVACRTGGLDSRFAASTPFHRRTARPNGLTWPRAGCTHVDGGRRPRTASTDPILPAAGDRMHLGAE